MDPITFYHEYDAYGWLSNYYVASFEVNGIVWPSSEHYYQAQKSTNTAVQEQIRNAATPDDSKKLGNAPDLIIRPDWKVYRMIAMRQAIHYKFSQNEELLQLLLETGAAPLAEDSPTDYYWGIGATKDGRNMLGIMLVNLRNELRQGL